MSETAPATRRRGLLLVSDADFAGTLRLAGRIVIRTP